MTERDARETFVKRRGNCPFVAVSWSARALVSPEVAEDGDRNLRPLPTLIPLGERRNHVYAVDLFSLTSRRSFALSLFHCSYTSKFQSSFFFFVFQH